MSDVDALRRQLLAEVKPLIDRIFDVLAGAIDGILDNADAIAALIKAGRN